MRIALMSDLHLDHYSDKAAGLLKSLSKSKIEKADVCVLAGDIADGRFPDQFFDLFAGLKKWFAHVVVITGNHEYYKTTFEQAHHSIEAAIAKLDARLGHASGVHFLHRNSVEIKGRTFHGHTMWYRDQPGNGAYEHWMNDINLIQGFRDWRYPENDLWCRYVRDNVKKGDVVVTHHLPSMKSVPRLYKNSETNRFFVCDMMDAIKDLKPALWLHGHTHNAVDYQLEQTRVVCNPRAYPREVNHGPDGYLPVYIEIEET
jgi:predicted phosphodiesterase